MLQLSRTPLKVIRIRFGRNLALIRFLDKVLVALLLGEINGILATLEAEMGALHEIRTALPAHQRILPAVALGQDIPVHAPVVRMPCAGLCRRLGWSVYPDEHVSRVEAWRVDAHTALYVPEAQLALQRAQRQGAIPLLHFHPSRASGPARMCYIHQRGMAALLSTLTSSPGQLEPPSPGYYVSSVNHWLRGD